MTTTERNEEERKDHEEEDEGKMESGGKEATSKSGSEPHETRMNDGVLTERDDDQSEGEA